MSLVPVPNKKSTLKQFGWFAVIGAGIASAVVFDNLAGRLLGAMVGTTTDPRQSLTYRGVNSLSMEPLNFTLYDRRAEQNIRDGVISADIEPTLEMQIPAAFIDSVMMKSGGNYGPNDEIWLVALNTLMDVETPYWVEWARLAPIVASEMGLQMNDYGDRPSRAARPWPVFPNQEIRAQFLEEMQRRGVVLVGMSFRAAIAKPEIERMQRVFVGFGVYLEDSPRSPWQPLEGCVMSEGPFPNSVRYDHHPDLIAALDRNLSRIRVNGSCILSRQEDAFTVVQYDDDDQPIWSMFCRNTPPSNDCSAYFLWDSVQAGIVAVDRAHMHLMPELIERARALFQSFKAAAQTDN